MIGQFEDALGNFDEITSKLYKSENVVEVFDFLDNLKLTSGNGRGKESEFNEERRELNTEQLRIHQEREKLNAEMKGYELSYFDLLKEKEAIEEAIEEKLNEKIPCKEDEDTLKKTRQNLRLYKDISGIRWDYTAPENVAKGYVCGGIKNYVNSFEFPLDDSTTDRLWQEIENASLKSLTDSKGKENLDKNVNSKLKP